MKEETIRSLRNERQKEEEGETGTNERKVIKFE
jgi:hypothetical protein